LIAKIFLAVYLLNGLMLLFSASFSFQT